VRPAAAIWKPSLKRGARQSGHGLPGDAAGLPVALYVRKDTRAAKLIKLIAQCGPLDMDDPQPAITVMLPDED